MITKEYKCIDAYEEPENPMEWLPCPRCGLRPLVWEFDNRRATACGCGTDCYSHWSVQAESIMSVIKRSDIRKYVEECVCNTYGNDNNIEQMIKFMVNNELKNKDFNVIPRMVEKVLRDKMLDNIEIIIRNKDLND